MTAFHQVRLRLPSPEKLICDGHYFARVYGEGEPMLLIHGNQGSGYVFADVIDALSAHYTVVVPDLPGHGFGPPMEETFLDDDMLAVNYVSEIMEKLGYSSFIAAGHSLGGMIALKMAITMSEKVKAVVMMDGFVYLPERSFPEMMNLGKYPGNPDDFQTLIDEAFAFGPGVHWHNTFDEREAAPKLSLPVLELVGEGFPGTEALYEGFLEKRKAYPRSWKTVRVPRSGHFITVEQPEIVSTETLVFLKENGLMEK